MKILAIETSCDETAVSIIDASGDIENVSLRVLGNALLSQISVHQQYGGVFPSLAKREHSRNLIPLLHQALSEAGMVNEKGGEEISPEVAAIMRREKELLAQFVEFIPKIAAPEIDAIAVTAGPGLEPALWVGINFAKALAAHWQKPLIPINHMEGHILSAMLHVKEGAYGLSPLPFPILSLLISGGHTELIVSPEWLQYKKVGQTRDDAVGEAFDKVARMLGLPYPGGPEISKLAEKAREEGLSLEIKLPRPMIHDATNDFSFAGLKTAVLYYLRGLPEVTEEVRKKVSREFEAAVGEVLLSKTTRALEACGARSVVIGGGVSANKEIRRVFEEVFSKKYPDVTLSIPSRELTGDNAVMIAVAAYMRILFHEPSAKIPDIIARGNLSF